MVRLSNDLLAYLVFDQLWRSCILQYTNVTANTVLNDKQNADYVLNQGKLKLELKLKLGMYRISGDGNL